MTTWTTAVAATSPYGWWKLDEASGTSAADSSGNSRTATYDGAASITYQVATSIPGDSGGTGITITANSASNVRFGASFNRRSVTQMVTLKSSTDQTGRLFEGSSSSRLLLQATQCVADIGTASVTLAYDPSALFDGNAHLIVWVCNTTETSLWVDGVEVATGSHADAGGTISTCRMKGNATGPASGNWDDYAIWTSVLSDTQIGDLWTAWQGSAAPATATLAGDLQRKTAAFTAFAGADLHLTADLQRKTASFTAFAQGSATLAGDLQRKTAAFEVEIEDPVVELALTGTLQPKTAAFSAEVIQNVTLAGSLQPKTATFSLFGGADVTLAGDLQRKTGAFSLTAEQDSAYTGEVMADSPYRYYRLGEPSGTTMVDSSGNAAHGVYAGSSYTQGVAGLLPDDSNTAVAFHSGTGTAPHADATSEFSVEALLAQYAGSNPWQVRFERAGVFTVVIGNNGGTPYGNIIIDGPDPGLSDEAIFTFTPPEALHGVRQHLAVTFDGTGANANLKLYVNGSTVTLTRTTGDTTIDNYNGSIDTEPLVVTVVAPNDPAHNVVLDEVAYFTTALSGARVLAHVASIPNEAVLAGSLRRKTSSITLTARPHLTLSASLRRKTAVITLSNPNLAVLAGTLQTKTAVFALTAVPGTDVSNTVSGRIRDGYASFTWSPTVVDPDVALIGPVAYDMEKAHAFTAPTVSDGRVLPYSPTIVAAPRHRDRILVGGHDVTYFRGVHTPTPSYRLVEPLLYGAGTLVLPQINPLFEELGAGELSWLDVEKTVKVQRVDPDTLEVVAEDYVGFITAFSIDGGNLTCDLGGEVTGRMALKHQQVPVFKSVIESNRMMYDSVVSCSPRPYTPRLGMPTGIMLAKFGGLNKLDYFNQLMALNTQVDGDQWTVGLKDNGTWGNYLKDRETVDFTIYFDDARIPTSLNRDISEEPNRVYATAVAPDGHKVDFRVYPGLKQGEAPEYPMSGGGSFGLGTTDEDTDTGSGITSMVNRLIVMGYLTRADGADYIYDADVAEAIKRLQDDAGLTESGNMNQNTWEALYDLSATGYSLAGATTLPAAQRSSVRQWNRTSSGALSTRNPNFDPHKVVVDAQEDIGTGFTAQQVRQWSRGELGTEGNWVGTATLHFTVVRGEHTPGDPIDPADVMPAREIRPGMNGFAPLFDGGTLFHVSGVEVPAGGRAPVLTLDTRARDTMKAWEVIQRNRDSRRDPARVWLNQYRSSKITKDGLGAWDKVGGIIDDRVALTGGEWTVFPVVAGQEGTIRRLRIRTNPNVEFCAAVFGRKVTAARLNHLVPAPLADGGDKWTKAWLQDWLEDRVYLESWGDHDQPAGYSPGAKSEDDPLTGVLRDDAQLSYHTFAEPVLWVAIWAADDCVVPPGRIMWQQLEEGS